MVLDQLTRRLRGEDPPEIGGHLAKGSSGRCIEREWIEIGFGLLEMRLPGRTLRIGLGNQWTDRQLRRESRRLSSARQADEWHPLAAEAGSPCWYLGSLARSQG